MRDLRADTSLLPFHSMNTAAGITLLAAISMIPLFCTYRDDRYYPTPAFSFFAFLAFVSSLAAFCFMIALYGIAIHRLHQDGFTATLGPAVSPPCSQLYKEQAK